MWPNRLSAFIEAILGRYQDRLEVPLGLGLVYRQARLNVTLRAAHHRTQLRVAPRLIMTVLGEAVASGRSPPGLQLVVQGDRIEAGDPTGRLPVADAATAPARQPGRVRPARQHVPLPLPPVPRVVQRPAPTGRADASPPTADPAGRRPAGTRAPLTVADAGSEAAESLDLGRLADQVIRAIDRRIIARRERLGRT
jgi:hypothetical protein